MQAYLSTVPHRADGPWAGGKGRGHFLVEALEVAGWWRSEQAVVDAWQVKLIESFSHMHWSRAQGPGSVVGGGGENDVIGAGQVQIIDSDIQTPDSLLALPSLRGD
jgi:hypothetical protein